MLTLDEMLDIASRRMASLEDGTPLSRLDETLVKLGIAASPVCLNQDALEAALQEAVEAGAGAGQIQEVITLVSGLGVHSLMVASPMARRVLEQGGGVSKSWQPDTSQQALWNRHVGHDPFWKRMDEVLPGFLESLLQLCSESFRAFFEYCAVPWKTGHLRAAQKELIALAVDATPGHRFLPGFLLHLDNAIHLGAGRVALESVLALARQAPEHVGIR